MSHKHLREESKTNASKNLPVVSKCLVIVLIPKARKNSGDVLDHEDANSTIDPNNGEVVRQSEIHKAPNSSGYNGKELLHDFKMRNKTCYWNPSLVESIKSLEYKGFVEPSTILVTGADIHLENLRSAWGRRVLKAPAGFEIERIGDVNGIEMQVIPQTQFMPLPDAVCSVLLDLNTRGVTATLEVILEKLSLWYRHMNVPSQQLVFDSLGQLIKDRKVFHTGSGYFVVTPDTSRLQTSWAANSTYVPSNASWLPYHPMYVPVFQGQMVPPSPYTQASRAHMRSISCQVTTIEDSDDDKSEDVTVQNSKEKEKEKTATLGRAPRPRSNSGGRNKDGGVGKDKKASGEKAEGKADTDGDGQFKRTASLKSKGEKGAKGGKDGSLKPGAALPDKEKEKTSFFSKIFSRKKKDRDKALMPPPPAPPPVYHPPAPSVSSASGSDVHSEGREPKEKEYATFSAQFPPPEWMWYQQQLEKQKRTETWVTHQTSKASAAVGGPSGATQGAKVTSRPPVPARLPHHYASSHRRSLASVHQDHGSYVPMGSVQLGVDGVHVGSDMARARGFDAGKPQPIRPDNLYESFRNPLPPPLPKARGHHHRKSRDMDGKRSHHHRHAQEQNPSSEYDVIENPGDVTPLHNSNVYHSVSALSPVTPWNEDSTTYSKLTMHQPQLGPLHSTPRVNLGAAQNERAAYRVEGHEARDRIYGGASQGQHRAKQKGSKAHRQRRKAQQRIYSYYSGGGGAAGSDISYEYKGKLPNKNSSRAQSRDSGVNCVGLAGSAEDGKGKGTAIPVYENTGKSDARPNQAGASGKPSQPNHVHFERGSGEAEGESSSHPRNSPGDVTNQAYNSIVYPGGDSTNQAYNSVVYGGSNSLMIETGHGPSVMYGTIATSHLDGSEMVVPKNSMQSGYYNDDEDSSVPASALITCQVEINPTAHESQVEELHSSPESLVDVVALPSPGVREVSGSSDGVLELAGGGGQDDAEDSDDDDDDDQDEEEQEYSDGDENATAMLYPRRPGAGQDGDCDQTEGDDYDRYCREPRHNSFSEAAKAQPEDENNTEGSGRPDTVDSKSAHGVESTFKIPLPLSSTAGSSSQQESTTSSAGHQAGKDQFVSDSGFSSPRNPEGATSNGSQTGSSFGQDVRLDPRLHHGNDEGSSDGGGHHTTSSDVNMGSSEHHSGSTTNGDSSSCCDTNPHSNAPRLDHAGSQLPLRAAPGHVHPSLLPFDPSGFHPQQGTAVQFLQPQPQNLIHMYQPSSLVAPHPDIYNNNSNISEQRATVYIEPSPPLRAPLHPNTAVLNNVPPVVPSQEDKPAQGERPTRPVDLWKQNNNPTPSELHRFEEEQRAKKYGVNGEFEVMGVL